MLSAARTYWGIEDRMHWVGDHGQFDPSVIHCLQQPVTLRERVEVDASVCSCPFSRRPGRLRPVLPVSKNRFRQAIGRVNGTEKDFGSRGRGTSQHGPPLNGLFH